ncbi:late competence development ComFB family protein [Endozoicomonas sp. SM1973]|uniref:Late competence development ComFB family protein n=1 Tax=Spartinivicinus marinus TaxID=2994442 RepID=A0A853I761_9GAMM|nr:late competence development ComFB family protein [Spartinivicinus marinus]MCX4025758.1 late competence development ComFB family protein [Spartinivicinus marinus]NYZ65751.1 late competence development ComFB family protein [Spartinivicinus marinus]
MALQEEFHNYYEHLVVDYIFDKYQRDPTLTEYLPDIACVALNHLPPRYIHYDIDMAYYLSPNERVEMESKVKKAVDDAVLFVRVRRSKEKAAEL